MLRPKAQTNPLGFFFAKSLYNTKNFHYTKYIITMTARDVKTGELDDN